MSDYGVGALIGAGMGLLLEGHNDRRQIEQQRRLQALQIQGQQQMGDYNYGKQLQFWKDTNFQAQMEQLRMAGLNPALLYKQGGAGGMTIGAPAGNVQGGAAPVGGMEIMNAIATKANIDLIKAQTEKTKAETTAVAPTIEKTQAETASLTQGISNQKVIQRLNDIQGDIAAVESEIKGKTQNAAIATILTTLRQATAQMDILERQNAIDEATKDEKIRLIEQELVGSYARNQLTRVQIGKTTAEIEQMAQQIKIAWQEVQNETDRVKIQQKLQEFETSFGGQAAKVLETLLGLIPSRGRKTTIEHTGGQTNTTTHKREK